jgi:hypothetical protein
VSTERNKDTGSTGYGSKIKRLLDAVTCRYLNYWAPLIEAAILAKVIMIGDSLRVGRGLRSKPLIVTTIYRTIVVSIFVGMFTVLEHIVGALIHHKSVSDGIEEITSKGWYELVARCVLVLVAFLPFSVSKKLDASGEGISFTLCSSGGHVDEGDSPHCRGKRDVHKSGFIGFNRVKNFSCPSNSIFPPVGRMHLCVI